MTDPLFMTVCVRFTSRIVFFPKEIMFLPAI